MPKNISSSQNGPSEDPPVLERLIQSSPLTETAKESTDASDLEAPVGASDAEMVFPPSPPDKQWGNDNEQEWSEHSATAWALAHVIHRIRSTPLPPILLPEQRRHFQQVIQMAAALMEEWQRRERDQAQQLAVARPPTLSLMDQPGMSEGHSGAGSLPSKGPNGTPSIEAEASLGQHLASDHLQESQEKDTANQKDQSIE